MLVKLRNSRLFDTSPAIRFGNQYGVSHDVWTELWKRYSLLEYTPRELAEYFLIKTGKQVKERQIKRWIFLTEVFTKTKPARDKRALVISTEIFGPLEDKVIEELTRHMKNNGGKRSYTIV